MYTIDLFSDGDCEEAGSLEKRVFGSDAWNANDYRESIALDYILYLAVHEEDKLIGVCGIRNMCGDGNITNVCVDPAYRRKGVATGMLKELIQRSRMMGVKDYTLEVRESNESAIKLYEKLGFKSEGIRPNFYSHPIENALIMWKRGE